MPTKTKQSETKKYRNFDLRGFVVSERRRSWGRLPVFRKVKTKWQDVIFVFNKVNISVKNISLVRNIKN